MITFDPGAPDSEPLERIATALEGIRRELGLLRDSVEYLARTATPAAAARATAAYPTSASSQTALEAPSGPQEAQNAVSGCPWLPLEPQRASEACF